ncbi:hypothetical protein SNE40_015552 [Patella caerulea]|uniref:Vacuolar ATPase assembly protein VMA22 n=1 Tax=Patella caerulea TaxID=87958 RepID=A0AAN8JK72_PATCE
MDLKEVSLKLDETLIEFFTAVKQLYQEQAVLEQYMKDGYLNLSRARYNMGLKAVGALQFNQNAMTALTKVDVNGTEKNSSKPFEITSSQIQKPSKNDEDGGLRKRNTGTDKSEKIENIGILKNDDSDIKEETVIDPLKWFGVLVPQNLRKSQSSFKQAVESVVTIANLKHSIINLQTEYRSLLEKKSNMLKNASKEN